MKEQIEKLKSKEDLSMVLISIASVLIFVFGTWAALVLVK
jgi:hypothetical protein